MRLPLALVAIFVAGDVHAANISPGAPDNIADYIQIGLGWQAPPYVFARARGPGNDFIPIPSLTTISIPRDAGGTPAEHGVVDFAYGMTPDAPYKFTIPFAPEIDNTPFLTFAVNLMIGNYVPGPRLIRITDPGGSGVYNREVTVQQTPEPTSWAMALAGCLGLLRRRNGWQLPGADRYQRQRVPPGHERHRQRGEI
jgi:hypothetical protein